MVGPVSGQHELPAQGPYGRYSASSVVGGKSALEALTSRTYGRCSCRNTHCEYECGIRRRTRAGEAMSAARTQGMGLIGGFVLRTSRESIPRSQEEMAELLGVSVATYQGWEAGRRPISNMQGADLLGLRRRLPGVGADPDVVVLLDAAMDADRVIGAALAPPRPGVPHPLCEWVHTRDTAHMIAWAVNGSPPPILRCRPVPTRHGPAASAPRLSPTERTTLFAHLRETAEVAGRLGAGGSLLHR
ncbi:helix-turn-helix domain-containing protein [Streptomyces sp. NPDC059564]|uniref:helix-turn-helix domain-containing protein n=1 Tax=Streptomyces sp. NPDC059564 TaxID=3346865 RepID=UPI0036BB49FF